MNKNHKYHPNKSSDRALALRATCRDLFLSKLVARTNGTASCEEQSDALSNDMESFVEKCDLQFDDSKQFSLTKFISRARC